MHERASNERVWVPPMPSAKPSSAPRWDVSVIVAAMIVMASVGYGSWLTALAIMDGDVSGSLLRFSASALIGAYYLVLYRTAQRQRRGQRRRPR